MNVVIIDQALESFAQSPETVGVSLGMVRQDETITRHRGEVEKNSGIAPTDSTIYEIGSITKTLTGVLLAQAAAEGRLSVHDDIRGYLEADYPNLEHQGQPIQLWHLISHLSGLPLMLPDQPSLFANPDPKTLPYKLIQLFTNYTRDNFYYDLGLVQINQVPGTQFQYSNAAAQLLGYILEKVYGSSYEALIQNNIAQPLGMRNSKITLSESERFLLAKGHDSEGTIMPNIPNEVQAAGALKSTVLDMMAYLRFHLDQGSSVVRQSQAAMWGDVNDFAIGLNWQINRSDQGHRRIFQSGGTFGFASYCAVYPDISTAVVLLTNESDPKTQSRLEQLANAIVLAA